MKIFIWWFFEDFLKEFSWDWRTFEFKDVKNLIVEIFLNFLENLLKFHEKLKKFSKETLNQPISHT